MTPSSGRDRLNLSTYTKIMRATNTVTSKLHRHLSEDGLTLSQFGVLEALFSLGPLCQRELGNKILKTSGNITTVIDNLEKRHLVVRKRDTDDRRYFRVELTPMGAELIQRVFKRHTAIAADVFNVLSEAELITLGNLMKKLGTFRSNN